ncbi:ABC transporter permease [Jeotgalibacillus malaysiensis]|uniref:ABC transporter permease n=1 Tax=Jeotgalibacillus malaysiensis TaxID=1508404 RepID=UPI00384FA293
MKGFTFTKEMILGLIAVLLFLAMSFFVPGFISSSNLTNMMFQIPEFGLLALAMMVVIVTGGIDLSITYIAALAGVIIALMFTAGYGLVPAILAGLAVGLLCGLLNGTIISKIGVSPILVTLGTMVLFEGVILSITKGSSISGFSSGYSLIGNGYYMGIIPLSTLIFIIFAVITAILLNKSKWGRSVYMVGSNPIASLFSGINTSKVLLNVYLYSALLAVVASIIMTSRYNTAKVDLGSSYLLQSVAAAVLGGTEIQGGYGKVMGTVFAVIIFQMLSSGMNLMGFPRSTVTIMMGVILITVLVINFLKVKWDEKKEKDLVAAQ